MWAHPKRGKQWGSDYNEKPENNGGEFFNDDQLLFPLGGKIWSSPKHSDFSEENGLVV